MGSAGDKPEDIVNLFSDDEDYHFSAEQLMNVELVEKSVLRCLKSYFGFVSFRELQWKIISAIIERKQDVLAVMATGYGKSLCFQFPSVYLNTVTLIVSPLISLMEDQIISMNLSNIRACMLGSAQKDRTIFQSVLEGEYRLVYLTPELLTSDLGKVLLERLKPRLSLIAIDEAHCISKWGHDFRAAFRKLGMIRRILPQVPILALTATATTQVREDIRSSLNMQNALEVCAGFDRPNLQFHVKLKSSGGAWTDIRPVLRPSLMGSTIIYCITRKQTEDIAQLLKSHEVHCEAYHAGLSLAKRKEVHEKFVRDEVRVIVATIAFGMGIDKPDVRQVIHYGASRDLESYYQEVGRAGRDGIASECYMFYSHADFQVLTSLRTMMNNEVSKNLEKLQMKMREYISTTECRRWFILEYFEGPRKKPAPNRRCCDNCIRNLQEGGIRTKYEGVDPSGCYDFSVDTGVFLKSMELFKGSTGLQIPLYFLRGSKNKRISQNLYGHELYGKGKNKSEDYWKSLANLLEEKGFLRRQSTQAANSFRIQTVSLTAKALDWLANGSGKPFMLKVPKDMYAYMKLKKEETYNKGADTMKPVAQSSKLANRDEKVELVKALMLLRIKLASEVNVMPYMVYSNRAIYQLAKLKPLTMEALKNVEIDGFSEKKAEKFGPRIIDSIKQFETCSPTASSEDSKAPVLEFLERHPIDGFKVTAGNIAVYDLWNTGKGVKEIAQIRGTTESTVSTHIAALIKGGYLIKSDLLRLGVNEDVYQKIVAKLHGVENVMSVTLKPLKEKCPASITYDQLKYVVSYYQLEHHVKQNGSDLSQLQGRRSATEAQQTFNVDPTSKDLNTVCRESSVEDDVYHITTEANVPDTSLKYSLSAPGEREAERSKSTAQYLDDDFDFVLSQISMGHHSSEGAIEQLTRRTDCDVSKIPKTVSGSEVKDSIVFSEDEGEGELNKLVMAIENDAKKANEDKTGYQNKQKDISVNSSSETSSLPKRRAIKRNPESKGKITFVDSSSDEEPNNKPKWNSKKQENSSAGPKWVKMFKSVDL